MQRLMKLLGVSTGTDKSCICFLVTVSHQPAPVTEIVLNCIASNIPVPAYESFFNKRILPRRYFVFFDVLYQAARHNKQLWKVVTELHGGENDIPYGSCIFEAHVMTTLQENYYKWLFLLLSDVDEVRDEDFEEQFRMEYECIDEESGALPKDLIDYQETNSRLRPEVELYYDESENDKKKLFKVSADKEQLEQLKRKERKELETLVRDVKTSHQKKVENLRERVKYVREVKMRNGRDSRLSDDDIKKLVSAEKRKLIQFRMEEEGGNENYQPELKKRKILNDHKSRCSDLKVHFFRRTKEMLDREEADGLIASWERVYKYIINKHMKSTVREVEPVMKEPSKMLNELSKAVDLDEIMNGDQNTRCAWTAL